MKPALSRLEVRELDRRAIEQFGIPGLLLMENAGRGAAELLLSLGVTGTIVIACGKGNNGGDGLVIARHLDLHGHKVRVLLFASPADLQGDAQTNWEIVNRLKLPVEVHAVAPLDEAALRRTFSQAGWIVDAQFGTGLQGPVRPPHDRVIEMINASGVPVLAVDIPSGLDCDSGQPLGPTVKATHTATFAALKRGFLASGAGEWTGQVHVMHIGVSPALL